MPESNEEKIAKAELKSLIEPLLRAATVNKVCIAGFIWGANPSLMIRFQNVVESGPDLAAILIELSSLAEDAEHKNGVEKTEFPNPPEEG